MKDNELDELFRSGLDTKYPVDQSLWSAVEPSLPTPSNGGGLWVFILNGIAIASVLFIGNYITENTKSLQATEIKKVATYAEIAKDNKLEVQEELIITANENQGTPITNTPQEEKIDDVQEKELTSQISYTDVAPIKNENSINGKLLTRNEYIKENTIDAASTVKQGIDSNRSFLSATTPPIIMEGRLIADIASSQAKSGSGKYMNANFLRPIDLALPLSIIEPSTLLHLTPKKNETYFQPNKSIQFSQFELVYSRSLITKKSVSGLSEAVIDLKANAEQNSSVTTIGLNLINHHKWLTYGIGVHYFKQEERVQYDIIDGEIRNVTSYDTTYNIVNTNYSSNGHPVILIENKINQVNTPTYVEFGNRLIGTNIFERIQVPVFIGASKQIRHWTAELRTGLVANYSLHQSGAYINEDLNELVGFEGRNQFNDLILSQTNNISIGYQLNETFSVGGRLNYEFDLTSVTTDYNSRLRTTRGGVYIVYRPR